MIALHSIVGAAPSIKVRSPRFALALPSILVLVSFVICAYRILWITKTYSVNVFIGDQWFYNNPTLFNPQSALGIFRWQSGPWRQGLGGLLTAVVGSLTRWNSRYESFVAAGLLIVGCALALYLKVRMTAKLTAWDALIPMLVLSPVEYQKVVGVTHYSHGPLPFMLVMAVGIAWTIRRYEVKYAALVILVVFCTYTGFGLFMGLLCPALIPLNLWMQRREISRSEVMAGAVGMGLMCLSPLSFFWGFSFSDGVCPPHAFTSPASGSPVPCPNPLHYFLFVSFMFANFVGLKAQMNLAQTILAGSGILILVIAGFLVACRRIRLSAVPLLLISYSALFAVATAHGRMCLGLGAAIGSRYMVYLVPSLIGMYLIAVTSYDRVGRLSLLALVVSVAISSSFVIHAADREDMAALRKIRTDWKECYLTEHSLLGCNHKTGATIYSYPDTIQNKIDLLERKRLNVFSGDAAIRR